MMFPTFLVAGFLNILANNYNFNINVNDDPDFQIRVRRDAIKNLMTPMNMLKLHKNGENLKEILATLFPLEDVDDWNDDEIYDNPHVTELNDDQEDSVTDLKATSDKIHKSVENFEKMKTMTTPVSEKKSDEKNHDEKDNITLHGTDTNDNQEEYEIELKATSANPMEKEQNENYSDTEDYETTGFNSTDTVEYILDSAEDNETTLLKDWYDYKDTDLPNDTTLTNTEEYEDVEEEKEEEIFNPTLPTILVLPRVDKNSDGLKINNARTKREPREQTSLNGYNYTNYNNSKINIRWKTKENIFVRGFKAISGSMVQPATARSVTYNNSQYNYNVNSVPTSYNGYYASTPYNGYNAPTPYNGQTPYNGYNGQTPYNGYNAQTPYNGYNGQTPYNGYNGQTAYNGYNAPTPINGHNAPIPYNGYNTPTSYNGYNAPWPYNAQTPYNGNSASTPYNVNGTQTPYNVNGTQTPFNGYKGPYNGYNAPTPYNVNGTLTPFNGYKGPYNGYNAPMPYNVNGTQTPYNVNNAPYNVNIAPPPYNVNGTSNTNKKSKQNNDLNKNGVEKKLRVAKKKIDAACIFCAPVACPDGYIESGDDCVEAGNFSYDEN